jgi:hypothetical protein
MEPKAFSVFVDGLEIKSGLTKQDAEDLRRSVAGVVKETTQVEARPTTQRATQ